MGGVITRCFEDWLDKSIERPGEQAWGGRGYDAKHIEVGHWRENRASYLHLWRTGERLFIIIFIIVVHKIIIIMVTIMVTTMIVIVVVNLIFMTRLREAAMDWRNWHPLEGMRKQMQIWTQMQKQIQIKMHLKMYLKM